MLSKGYIDNVVVRLHMTDVLRKFDLGNELIKLKKG
jgi:hypothetical protein